MSAAAATMIGEKYLLRSHVAALEQLLEVYEQAAIEQSEKLEEARAALARRVEDLGREIDERKRAEENLRRSERLASIGTLAAGLAHEINNPLGLIALEVHHALRSADDQAAVTESLLEIKGCVKRCARIVKSVLQFAREETTEKWPEALNEIAEHARDLTREAAVRHGVAVELCLDDELPLVVMNPTEMEQVFVNLIHNAIHASERGGRVVIETRLLAGGVRVVVRDEGCGMAEADREKAFDPFYTTRSLQGGTGLGLSTCHGIVTELGGSIVIESSEGAGTAVLVELPAGPMASE
jgi:two-component system NtrC family sensor kinase